MKIRVFMATVLLLISHCVFSTTSLPHIVILATGGTIAGTAANNTQTAGYKSGELGVQTLINAVPEMNNIARVDGEQVANIGSENMTSDIILKLSQKVNALLARDDVDGVVITHGTDTLDETAYFLNLTVKSDKPVVFTAAMRPASAISADGAMNLLEAVTVAADPNAKGRGVMVWGGNYFCTDRRCYKLIVKSTTTRPMGDLGILHCAEKNDLKMIFLP